MNLANVERGWMVGLVGVSNCWWHGLAWIGDELLLNLAKFLEIVAVPIFMPTLLTEVAICFVRTIQRDMAQRLAKVAPKLASLLLGFELFQLFL